MLREGRQKKGAKGEQQRLRNRKRKTRTIYAEAQLAARPCQTVRARAIRKKAAGAAGKQTHKTQRDTQRGAQEGQEGRKINEHTGRKMRRGEEKTENIEMANIRGEGRREGGKKRERRPRPVLLTPFAAPAVPAAAPVSS